jgi:hypothetical protein
MNLPTNPKSSAYRATIDGLLRLHELTLARQDESPEADSIRESMADVWEDLSPEEKDRVTAFSKDLYEISDGMNQS